MYSNYSSGGNYTVRMFSNLKSGTVQTKDFSYPAMMNQSPSALKVSPHTTSQSNLFIGLKNGKLIKIENTTASFPNNPVWTDISGTNFVGSISDIEFGANEKRTVCYYA